MLAKKGVKNMKNELKAEKFETISWTPLSNCAKVDSFSRPSHEKVLLFRKRSV
jgi:hypothetical protein